MFALAPGILSRTIEAHLGLAEHPGLRVGPGHGRALLTAHEAREAVRAHDGNVRLRAAVWRAAIQAAQTDASDGRARLFALWLAGPWLRRTLTLIAVYYNVIGEDLEAEFATAFLEELPQVDAQLPDPGAELLRAASKPVWRMARLRPKLLQFVEPALPEPVTDLGLPSPNAWELEYVPPLGRDHLPASLRFISSAEAVEGVRIGALAQRLGLADVVLRARRPAEDVRVGTLVLRPVGAAR